MTPDNKVECPECKGWGIVWLEAGIPNKTRLCSKGCRVVTTSDQQLFEKVKRDGECWHEWGGDLNHIVCVKCHTLFHTHIFKWVFTTRIPDFTTPEGFFWLWERMSEKQEWPDFWDFIYEKAGEAYLIKTKKEMHPSMFWQIYLAGIFMQERCLINPLKFRAVLMEFWGIKEVV